MDLSKSVVGECSLMGRFAPSCASDPLADLGGKLVARTRSANPVVTVSPS